MKNILAFIGFIVVLGAVFVGGIIASEQDILHITKEKEPEGGAAQAELYQADVRAALMDGSEFTLVEAFTEGEVGSVRVGLPGGPTITIPRYTDIFTPEIDQTTKSRFLTSVPGLPVAGEEYTFKAFDPEGNSISGAEGEDIWVGVQAPQAPANINAEVVANGILVTWDECPLIPDSFEPAATPQLGYYQIAVVPAGGQSIYGASNLPAASHLIPESGGDLGPNDRGKPISEWGDGTYQIQVALHSVAPQSVTNLEWGPVQSGGVELIVSGGVVNIPGSP